MSLESSVACINALQTVRDGIVEKIIANKRTFSDVNDELCRGLEMAREVVNAEIAKIIGAMA